MSRYKGQLHGGKRANKFGEGFPPPFRAMPERKRFFSSCEVFPNGFSRFMIYDNTKPSDIPRKMLSVQGLSKLITAGQIFSW